MQKAPLDSRLVLLGPQDNCLIACSTLAAGTVVQLENASVRLEREVAVGHKLARHDLAVGDKVLKYGAVIGSMRSPVQAGQHIHTHNMASDYLPTYTLQAGASFVDH